MTKRTVRMAILAGIAVMSAGSIGWAATPATSPAGTGLVPGDIAFVLHAAESGAGEVALGRVAAGKATSDDVRQFGERMVKDHSMANQELVGIATSKGLTAPQQPGPSADLVRQALTGVAKASFDKDYIGQQVGDHMVAVALFGHCAQSCADSELKSFAAKHLPALQEHLKMAEALLVEAKKQAGAN